MIDRYSLPEMAAVFSDTTRFGRYLEIELLATEAQAALGVVRVDDAETCRARAPVVDAAFVRAVGDRRIALTGKGRAFGRFVEQDLVYKGKKPVHWCIHCRADLQRCRRHRLVLGVA